jgi:hypothetical protein
LEVNRNWEELNRALGSNLEDNMNKVNREVNRNLEAWDSSSMISLNLDLDMVSKLEEEWVDLSMTNLNLDMASKLEDLHMNSSSNMEEHQAMEVNSMDNSLEARLSMIDDLKLDSSSSRWEVNLNMKLVLMVNSSTLSSKATNNINLSKEERRILLCLEELDLKGSPLSMS